MLLDAKSIGASDSREVDVLSAGVGRGGALPILRRGRCCFDFDDDIRGVVFLAWVGLIGALPRCLGERPRDRRADAADRSFRTRVGNVRVEDAVVSTVLLLRG